MRRAPGALHQALPHQRDRLLADAVEWAHSVRLHALILDMVLAGEVDIEASADGDDLSFRPTDAARAISF